MKAVTEIHSEIHTKGQAHCPICTHTVPADIDLKGRRPAHMEVPAMKLTC